MNAQKNNKMQILDNDNVKGSLTKLAIPGILAMLVNAIYNFVDVIFIGQLNNTLAMGAVSIGFPILLIITGMGLMIGVGSASYISRSLGASNEEQANKTASIAVTWSLIISTIVTILGLIFIEPILRSMGATPEVLPYAVEYTRWIIVAATFLMINMVLNNVIRAEGKPQISMISIGMASILNVILDPIFIFTLDMGVGGASFATIVAQGCATLFLISYFLRGKSVLTIRLNKVSKKLSADKEIYKQILKIGSPVFIMQFLSSVTFGMLNFAAITYGSASMVAAMAIVNKINMIPSYVFMGFVQGLQPFAAFNYGAGNIERLKKAVKFSTIVMVSLAVFFLVVLQTTAGMFIGIFTKDQVVFELGVNYLKGVTIMTPFVAFTLLYTNLFQSLGKAKQALMLTLGRQTLIFIPMVIVLPKLFIGFPGVLGFTQALLPYKIPQGLYGVMYAQAATDLITVMVTITLAYFLNKEFKKAIANN
ncbi:MAG: MATE family efflux transporter [Clostridium sp.]|uniref:MATE family efflux transporter n=1 Tax=Clostridium sp. TaxID=1506 RepID=UPI002FCBF991